METDVRFSELGKRLWMKRIDGDCDAAGVEFVVSYIRSSAGDVAETADRSETEFL